MRTSYIIYFALALTSIAILLFLRDSQRAVLLRVLRNNDCEPKSHFPRKSDNTTSHSIEISENIAALLYTNEGHGHIPLPSLKDGRLSPLTKWVQRYIYEYQHPADCSQRPFLISDGYPSGFGSEMHVIGSHLAYAIQYNYTLLLSPRTCGFFIDDSSCSLGCACYFRPITTCGDINEEDPKVDRISTSGANNRGSIVPDIFKKALLDKIPSMRTDEIKYWWRGQSVAYLMRFNDDTVRAIATLRHNSSLQYLTGGRPVPFPFPSGTMAAHIRGGDKYYEMKLVPPIKYVDAASKLIVRMPHSFSRFLFVSADDPAAITKTKRVAEKRALPYIYSRIPRIERGHSLFAWDHLKSERAQRFYGHLLQLVMSLEADAWIGTRASNWNRMIDELRCIWVDKCPNIYVEVGGPVRDIYEW